MKLPFVLILLIVSLSAFAQQDPLYSQYINNPFVINPAYAGFNENLSATLSYRQQWTGFEGSPKTINANGNISLLNNKVGAGMMIVSDQIGNTEVTEIQASYAYRIKLDGAKTVSFGLQAGAANYKVNNSEVTAFDPGDPLFEGDVSETKPTFGAGIILNSDRYFIGLSVPRMLESSFTNNGVVTTLYSQHYYAMASYIFFLSERVRFRPSVLSKLVSGSPASYDLNASFILYENYQAGVLTRNFNTYGLLLQAQLKDSFRLGYVFEVPASSSVGTNFTTHEITLGIRLRVLPFHNNKAVMSF